MAAFKEELPVAPAAAQEPFLSEKPYKGIEVDSKYSTVSAILCFVEGSSWTVEYYRQLLTEDNELTPQQTGLEAVYQQYQLISGFELKVTEPLSSNFDAEKGEHVLEGGAVLYPTFKPNKGDMFIADIGDGRAGVFEINSVEQRSVLKDSTYAIRYKITDYLTETHKEDFDSKTVLKTNFVKDFARINQNPIVQTEDFNSIEALKQAVHSLQELWLRNHLDYENKTPLVPKQKNATYDPYLMNHLEYFCPQQLRDPQRRVTVYVPGSDPAFDAPTIWEVLVKGDRTLFWNMVQELDVIDIQNLGGAPVYGSMRFSKLRKTLFPKGRGVTVGNAYRTAEVVHYRLESPYSASEKEGIDLEYLLRRKVLNGLGETLPENLFVPLIHPVGIDDYYVLSEYFYKNTQYGQSKLELQAQLYLDHKAMSLSTLVELWNDVRNWGQMESFYYVPVLIFLIQAALRGF